MGCIASLLTIGCGCILALGNALWDTLSRLYHDYWCLLKIQTYNKQKQHVPCPVPNMSHLSLTHSSGIKVKKKIKKNVPWKSECRRMWNLSPSFWEEVAIPEKNPSRQWKCEIVRARLHVLRLQANMTKTTTTKKIALGCKPDEDWTSVIPVLTQWDDTGWPHRQLTKVTIKIKTTMCNNDKEA